ncbi:MAG: hypothetical protein MUQ26_01295, partial [Armatimonadetes bacterium]|nr:hypothetical protein [Armatimonadota bacterium]
MRYGRIAFVLAALAGAVVSSPGGAATAGGPGEFTPDEHTTLLAHFDESVTSADYANGWADFGGSGATQIEGYYG